MSREHYNPEFPSVTGVIRPLCEEYYNNIPEYNLTAARDRGIKKHDLAAKYVRGEIGIEEDSILNLLLQGLDIIEPQGELHIEEYLCVDSDEHGVHLQGTPDLWCSGMVDDYKFTSMPLRNEVALQLTAYQMLIHSKMRLDRVQIKTIDRLIAFHFIGNSSLIIQRVRDEASKQLQAMYLFLLTEHLKIKGGGAELFEALSMWAELQEEYGELFEVIGACFLPLTITNIEQAQEEALAYKILKGTEKMLKFKNGELKRYLKESDEPLIEIPGGGALSLQESNRKQYKKIPEDVKEKYYKGTNTVTSLVENIGRDDENRRDNDKEL